MKKYSLIAALFAIFMTSLFAQPGFYSTNECNQTVVHNRLTICYNYQTKEADYVTYYATGVEVNASSDRLSFKEDPLIPEEYRATDDDYYKSGFDRFHMCPDNIMDFNQTLLADTYYLSNAVPGDPYTNRYQWIKVEGLETDYYISQGEETSYSITGVIHTMEANDSYIGNHIVIPEYFYKCFAKPYDAPRCYIMPNNDPINRQKPDVSARAVSLQYLNSLLLYDIYFQSE